MLAEPARFVGTLGFPKTQFENNLGSKTTLQMSMMKVLVMVVMVLVTVLVVLVVAVVVYESSLPEEVSLPSLPPRFLPLTRI